MKIYSSSPYYDDYDEMKGFHRILFKPGLPVQARELTQLQTILQNQISRFGQNIFKEGAIVIPGQQLYDPNYKYVKLAVSYNSVNSDDVIADLVGDTITGQTTGIRAQVVNYTLATDTDPPTIFIKYLDSGTNFTSTSFSDSEILINSDSSISLQAASSNAAGIGSAYSVTAGVIFTKGSFVYFDNATTILSKYSDTPTRSVGFVVTEQVVTSEGDTSLLDPAIDSYNYFAPGADRFQISLELTSRSFVAAETDDENYVEIARVEDGAIISQKKPTDYNILNDVLARRTYDESGNYTVRPYKLELIEHLRTSNTSIRDGLLTASEGGNSDLFVSVVKPGKAYVLGYEIDSVKTQYIASPKARDFISVNNSTISTETGNYVFVTGLYSIPDLATLPSITLYNQFTASNGSASGTRVGTARVRSLEYHSGTGVTAIYRAYLFDIQMVEGYTFERDVKQIYYDNSGFVDFTGNVRTSLVSLTGTASVTNGSNTIVGIGTRFNSELKVGDYVNINGSIAGNVLLVSNILSDVAVYVSVNATANVAGITISRLQSEINLPAKSTYIYEFPYSTIRSVDPTNVETTYSTRRVYDRTLALGNVSITAGTDEVFAPYSTDNYIVVNKVDGSYVDLDGKVTRSGSPTGKTVTFTLGAGLGSNDVRIITTVQKTSSAADKKNKTLTSTTLDFTGNTSATSRVLSLGQADIYTLSNVRMSANAFGTPYFADNSIDITDRYVLDNGQRKTHYDLGTLTLKPGSPVPTGPIRIAFRYFTHSSGDYFSVSSYGDIDYKDIPTFVDGSKTYQLRDCLDFRPRIDTSGISFTSPPEFLDSETDLITDYSYYVGRTDKIVLDSSGRVKVVQGISSENPQEPATPADSMALYVLKQEPYVFNVKEDIEVSVVDNKRFTMRDIGRIENRVKNLEYYTTLSLLEKDTSLYQIKDNLGFDRFKNGFVVDNFTGHKIGDSTNPDYNISMDFDNGILRVPFYQTNLKLYEINSNNGARASNNYTLTGGILSLPYTSNLFVESNVASRTENINPFSVINYTGTVELDPPSDVWFEQERAPDIYIDKEGDYSTLAAARYDTVWGSWQTTWYGSQRVEERTGTSYKVVERIDTTTNNDVVVSKVIVPKMRSTRINFNATGLKPNTKLQAYFNNYRVTDLCTGEYTATNTQDIANVFLLADFTDKRGNIITDTTGNVSGTFYYDSALFDFPSGESIFRLTDSPTNGNDNETAAEARFNSSGELITIRNEIISTRNGYVSSETVFDRRNVYEPVYIDIGGSELPTPAPAPAPAWGYADLVYGYAFGRVPDVGASTWNSNYDQIRSAVDSISAGDKAALASFVNSQGSIDPFALEAAVSGGGSVLTSSPQVQQAYSAIKTIVDAGVYNKEGTWNEVRGTSALSDQNFMHPTNVANGMSIERAASLTAAQLAVAILTDGNLPGGANYKDAVVSANDNPNYSQGVNGYTAPGVVTPRTCWGPDPLAQTFNVVASPVVITGVDIFFSTKDETVPMMVEIRKVVNGIPTQDIVPFSRKVVYPSQITTSLDGSVATYIEFEGLVYLAPGEYAVVLLANSVNYRVWISQIGETDVISGRVISEQPFIGTLYKSQNASTWTADQTQDLKFRLYRAKFNTAVSSTIDLIVDSDEFQKSALEFDALEAFPNSPVLRVYQDNHGFVQGSTVKLSGIRGSDATISSDGNVFGINAATINNVEFSVANVKLDSYTINMPTSANVTSVTRSGGRGAGALTDLQFDAIYPAISYLDFAGTKTAISAKLTQSGYSLSSSFIDLAKETTTELSTTQVIPCDVNVVNNLSGARPFTLRVTLTTDNEYLSPLVDVKQNSVVFIRNKVNNPSYATENISLDVVTLASRNDISFTKLSTNTGLISFVTVADKANVTAVVKGTTVTVSNTTVNNGTFRVLEVLDSGANLKVFGNVTTLAAANVVTVTNGIKFVAEEATSGGSAIAKYITKRVDFTNPSTSINLRMDVDKPDQAEVKVYYKTILVGETADITTKEYTEITGITIPTSLSGEFFEVEKQIDNLPQFESLVIKIVLLASDSAAAPKVKNLRVIALE